MPSIDIEFLTPFSRSSAHKAQQRLFRLLQTIKNQSITARAIFQATVHAADGRAGRVELVRDVLIGFACVELPRNLPALRHGLQFVDGAHVFEELRC